MTPKTISASCFAQYKRKGLSEMRPYIPGEDVSRVSISEPDRRNGSPKEGDMIARNPKNHADQWLVAKKYFEENLEPAEQAETAESQLATALAKLRDAGDCIVSLRTALLGIAHPVTYKTEDKDPRAIARNALVIGMKLTPMVDIESALAAKTREMEEMQTLIDEAAQCFSGPDQQAPHTWGFQVAVKLFEASTRARSAPPAEQKAL